MFFGSVCYNNTVPSQSFTGEEENDLRLDCTQIKKEGFIGGYYLHPLLPYRSEDVYFYDDQADIMVLLSGAVYNKPAVIGTSDLYDGIPDPEMIAGMFLNQGPAFAERLNGDFAVFIIRPGRREAYLFRDHLGVRPIAWAQKGEALHFSTDITGMSRALGRGEPIDSEYLLGYFKYIDYRRTPNHKIRKLPPGHFLLFTEGGISLTKYWEPEKIRVDNRLTYDRMVSDLNRLLQDAVRIRCDRRFTAGAHVSGGLDSGVVSALARKEYGNQKRFYGFSWSPARFEASALKHDERTLVTDFCTAAGIHPVFSGMTEAAYLRCLSRSWYNKGYFSEDEATDNATAHGVNLMFSGWGGDEFISTGHSGIDLDLLRRFKLWTFLRRNPLHKPGQFVRRFLFYVLYPALHILHPGSARGFRRDARYIAKSFAGSDMNALRYFYFHSSRRKMHLNVFRFYNIPERCESWHRLGFAKGLEYRYPLLDRRIVEYMLKVPSELLCKTGQFRPLPRELGIGLLPDEVRSNEDKNDPVYWTYMDVLNKAAALEVMDETEGWRANGDMKFVNFDLLLKDISEYRLKGSVPEPGVLFKTLVWLKAINDFTASYREGGIR